MSWAIAFLILAASIFAIRMCQPAIIEADRMRRLKQLKKGWK